MSPPIKPEKELNRQLSYNFFDSSGMVAIALKEILVISQPVEKGEWEMLKLV